MDIESFRDPGKEYRPSPFWSWNDDLRDEELRRQVREMKEQGFGGYFMHSRTGLKTPYLSGKWFDCISSVLDEGKLRDMESWLYDEDKFPSGFAGGKLTEDNKGYAAKYLKMIHIDRKDAAGYLDDKYTAALFSLSFYSSGLICSKRITCIPDIPMDAASDTHIYAFKVFSHTPTNWYNGQSYGDLLDEGAAERFIELTHASYNARFGGDFGEHMPGIFTDEPCYINEGPDTIPWTDGFDDFFRSITGYGLIENMPSLFFEYGPYLKIRYQFFYAVTKRFIKSFSKRVYDYCSDHGLKLTGHYLEEDSLHRQMLYIGAAMPHYMYMHIPGIDHLGRNIDNPLVLKQCSSVGHQFGRNRILCEIFGVSGHSMTFEDQKWIADFHFSLGITFLCQHLYLYSMTGERKRDYPPTISCHQPYWQYYKQMNDYFARAGWVCSQGDYAADLLVLHPIGSVWASFERQGRFYMGRYDTGIRTLTDILLSCQTGFDFGDEMIMEEKACVCAGGDGPRVKIAEKGSYKAVIVPPSLTWSAFTYNLLREFASAGGTVIFAGEKPEYIKGTESRQRWQELDMLDNVYAVDNVYDEIYGILSVLLENEVRATNSRGETLKNVYVHARRDGCLYYCFISNKDRESIYEAVIDLPVTGRASELDMITGGICPADALPSGHRMKIGTLLHPAGSRAYVVDTSLKPAACVKKTFTGQREVMLPEMWPFKRLHKNSLTLDYCRYSINEGAWSCEVPVWKVRKELWDISGLKKYEGIQPWLLDEKGIREENALRLKLHFRFLSEITRAAVSVVIEKVGGWELSINGIGADTQTNEWYWDRQFGSIDISRYLRKGVNDIVLSCIYRRGTEIEDIYLAGGFGVSRTGYRQYALVMEGDCLKNGSWVYQGYPFYSGSMLYTTYADIVKTEGARFYIRLEDPRGSLFRISANGSDPLCIISQPWEADITDLCINGKNKIDIEVAGTLRNTFGPLHHRLAVQEWCGPAQFTDESNWSEQYQFEDYGLIGGAVLIEKRSC